MDLAGWKLRWIGLSALAWITISPQAAHAQGPENVLLVVNTRSPISRDIGAYYQTRRKIPASNLCHIQTEPDAEDIARSAYDREIAAPIANCLRQKGLVEQILYIVTTKGIPLRIERATGDALESDGAAVDSELALLYGDLQQRALHPAKGPLQNPFFAKRNQRFEHPAVPIYMVTRLAAYSLAEVRGMIDRGLRAKNEGMFVIDGAAFSNDEGDGWLISAAARIPKERLLYDQDVKPVHDAKNVIGYASWGSNDKARRKRFLNFEWLPGAIATEFVSSNGRTFARPPDKWTLGVWDDPKTWFNGSPQSLTADIIADGASAATGHVAEPYLQFTPRPEYLLPAYYSGRNLAESYYMSIPALSWQNIIVGDPLMKLGPLPQGQ